MIASPVSGLYILKNGGKCGIIYDVGQTDKSEFVKESKCNADKTYSRLERVQTRRHIKI